MIKALFSIFFPKLCVGCQQVLLQAENILCVSCVHNLPLTNFHTTNSSILQDVFYGTVVFKNATALLYFYKKGIAQKLIHQLKYKDNQKIGEYLGDWLSSEIKHLSQYQQIDVIIPVPIHKKRLQQRGYNQVEKFGKILAKNLNATYNNTALIRVKNTKSQTFKTQFNRSENINTVFKLIDTQQLQGKHILLVDDVITTGSTIKACVLQLQKTANIKLSLAVMAYTEK